MVTFITGPMNSGKTTRLIAKFHKTTNAEGVAMVKVMQGDKVHSYLARRLSTGEERRLVLRDQWLAEGFDERCRIGPYVFSDATLEWIESYIRTAVISGAGAIFIDEVGVLELEGKGYNPLLRWLLTQEVDLYLTARQDLIEDIKETFDLKSATTQQC